MKRCPGCGEMKPFTAFGRNRRMSDGLQSWCKVCHGAAKRRWDAKNPERKRELSRRWHSANRDLVNARVKARYHSDPEASRADARRKYHASPEPARVSANRRRNLRKYGISEGEYRSLLAAQEGGCAICGARPAGKRLHIDHCHTTGTVRGLLCSNCNLGIGNFRDSPGLLMAAIHYLAKLVKEVA